MTPAQRAKAEVYQKLGYKPLGQVGDMATVTKPLPSGKKGAIVQVINADGMTVKTIVRRK